MSDARQSYTSASDRQAREPPGVYNVHPTTPGSLRDRQSICGPLEARSLIEVDRSGALFDNAPAGLGLFVDAISAFLPENQQRDSPWPVIPLGRIQPERPSQRAFTR
jgi:hypothetical protein